MGLRRLPAWPGGSTGLSGARLGRLTAGGAAAAAAPHFFAASSPTAVTRPRSAPRSASTITASPTRSGSLSSGQRKYSLRLPLKRTSTVWRHSCLGERRPSPRTSRPGGGPASRGACFAQLVEVADAGPRAAPRRRRRGPRARRRPARVTISSISLSRSRSCAVILSASAARSRWLASFQRMAAQPSGEITE